MTAADPYAVHAAISRLNRAIAHADPDEQPAMLDRVEELADVLDHMDPEGAR